MRFRIVNFLSIVGIVFIVGGCGSGPEKKKIPPHLVPLTVKGIENEPIQSVMLKINSAQRSWMNYVRDLPKREAAARVKTIEKYLREATSKRFNEILNYLIEGREFFKSIAAFAVGWPRNPDAIEPLIQALRDDSNAVVANACLGLYVLCLPEIPVEPLEEVAKHHDDPDCRANAVLALSALAGLPNGKRVRPILLDLLTDKDARIRVHALRGLFKVAEKDDVDKIIPLIKDPIPLVRRAAVGVAGKLGGSKAVEALISAVSPEEPDKNVRLFARKALQRISKKDGGYNVNEWKRIFALELLESNK